LNDPDLLERLCNGDPEAYRDFVNTWKDMVFNTSLGIVQNIEDAEDVAQEVFVQVYQSIASFKGEAKISTWLYRITITKSLDHQKKKKRKKRFAFVKSLFGMEGEQTVDIPEFHHPGIALENKEKAAELFRAIGKLPEMQKTAFTLNKIEGLSYQEISEVMETSLSSVESLIHRAKNNLKKYLEDYYKKG
jgi:RNA polymerase sigma-70 factor (ECF subfamily)